MKSCGCFDQDFPSTGKAFAARSGAVCTYSNETIGKMFGAFIHVELIDRSSL